MRKHPQFKRKVVRKLEECLKVVESHRRDHNDMLRSLYTGELTSVDHNNLLKSTLYADEKIISKLKEVSDYVANLKEGEDDE